MLKRSIKPSTLFVILFLFCSCALLNREELVLEKHRLENDLDYIEKLAREKYRMAKPGEKVFKVISDKENAETKIN